jgi:hypothetical protein
VGAFEPWFQLNGVELLSLCVTAEQKNDFRAFIKQQHPQIDATYTLCRQTKPYGPVFKLVHNNHVKKAVGKSPFSEESQQFLKNAPVENFDKNMLRNKK